MFQNLVPGHFYFCFIIQIRPCLRYYCSCFSHYSYFGTCWYRRRCISKANVKNPRRPRRNLARRHEFSMSTQTRAHTRLHAHTRPHGRLHERTCAHTRARARTRARTRARARARARTRARSHTHAHTHISPRTKIRVFFWAL